MKILKIFIICILAMLLNTNCSLEMEPKGNASGEQVWGNAKGCEQLLSGAYARLRRILIFERPMYLYGDLPANAAMTHTHGFPGAITNGNYIGSYINSYGWHDWKPYFQVINTTTTLLKHINDVPLSDFSKDADEALLKRNRIRGEAYFVYAFTYFYMVRIWGDLPLVKESFESSSQGLSSGNTIPRKQSPEKEILEYLLEHINAAISLLDFDKPDNPKWAVQADRAAALNLKAHVLMWLVRDMDRTSADYVKYVTEADNALNILINQSNRSLVNYDRVSDVVDMFDGKSSEGIFELNVSVDDNESFHINPKEWALHQASYKDITRGEVITELDKHLICDPGVAPMLYPANDKRRTLFYQNFGKGKPDHLTPPFLLKYAAKIVDDASTPGSYFTNSNVLIFRLSESILLRAEVLTRLGRPGNAKELLNQIRRRAGIGDFRGSNDDLIKEIYEERARELAGEGHSAYDRIRNDYWGGHTFMNAERKALKGYYWPVDILKLISANNQLVQVPFWAGKL